MERRIKTIDKFLVGRVSYVLEDVITGEKFTSEWQDNLIVNTGYTMFLTRLGDLNTTTSPGIITYGAVGTGNTVAVVGDTTLETELARKLLSVSSYTGTTLTLKMFFTKAEAVGTISEMAWFGDDATAAADSGQMLNRLILSPTISKTTAKTLTIIQTFSKP